MPRTRNSRLVLSVGSSGSGAITTMRLFTPTPKRSASVTPRMRPRSSPGFEPLALHHATRRAIELRLGLRVDAHDGGRNGVGRRGHQTARHDSTRHQRLRIVGLQAVSDGCRALDHVLHVRVLEPLGVLHHHVPGHAANAAVEHVVVAEVEVVDHLAEPETDRDPEHGDDRPPPVAEEVAKRHGDERRHQSDLIASTGCRREARHAGHKAASTEMTIIEPITSRAWSMSNTPFIVSGNTTPLNSISP